MPPKVSVIVSAYHATPEELVDRIDNLFKGTFTDIEVILVMNDPDNDIRDIIDYLTLHYMDRLRVLYPKREGIYASWNRGIRVAHGEYVTNANIDDRHFKDGLEILVKALDTTGAGLVYGESAVTHKIPPATFEVDDIWEIQSKTPPYTEGILGLRDFALDDLLAHHCIGNCPMWRRELHFKHGYFDDAMQLAADYEWALRLQSRGVSFYYVRETVATFYFGRNATTLHQSQSDYEANLARLRWQKVLNANARSGLAGGSEARSRH